MYTLVHSRYTRVHSGTLRYTLVYSGILKYTLVYSETRQIYTGMGHGVYKEIHSKKSSLLLIYKGIQPIKSFPVVGGLVGGFTKLLQA